MAVSDDAPEPPTRRDVLGYGALAGGSLLAGCTGGVGSDPTPAPSERETTSASGPTTTADDAHYTVSMAPVGEVEFEAVPERIFTRLTHHAGMAFALGRGDDVNALHAPEYYDGLWNQFTPRLPGVSLDWTGAYSSWKASKEELYALDSDVHLADPAWVTQLDAWSQADVEEVAENVAPWFGNSLSDRHQEPPAAWADRYRYYGLWEQFEKVAAVFRETERYEALAAVRADLLGTIESGVPPEGERPTAAMIAARDVEAEIWAYTLDTPGFLTAHTRPLGPRDAFGGAVQSNSTVDIEALLEADPDVILYLGGMQPGTNMAEIRSTLESDPVAAEITAVREGHVYPQGARYQGPILNLFQLEMSAKQLYPDVFGEWPEYDDGPYPEIPEEELLFDRRVVANAIREDV